jgi:hypothetical protein
MNWVNPLKVFVCAGTFVLALAATDLAQAETILKLNLGGDTAADIQYDGTNLSTISDGIGGTTGQQNTTIDFLGFLGVVTPNPMPNASFTMSNVAKSGAANTSIPGLVVQAFVGGDFYLYDDLNALLLSGTLGGSTLSGPLGPPATGALFTTTLGSISGGSLAGMIEPNSVSLSMSMTSVNGAAGFSVTSNALNSFTTDVTLNIAADPREIPEPASAVLGLVGGLLVSLVFRRRS